MKKMFLVSMLVCTIVLAGCSIGKKSDTTINTGSDSTADTVVGTGSDSTADTVVGTGSDSTADTVVGGTKYSFEDANCQSYVKLMECLIDKTPEASKEQTQKSFDQVMSMWKGLDKSVLPTTCKQTMDLLADQKEIFTNAGCPLQ